jgi:hypothetical protein
MPRPTLDQRLSKVRTFDVLLTKTTEKELWEHFVTGLDRHEAYYRTTRDLLDSAAEEARDKNPYTNIYDWRRGHTDHKRKIHRRYEKAWWYYGDDEEKSAQNEWFLSFFRDMELCGRVFEWDTKKPEFPSILYQVTRMKEEIYKMGDELVEQDKDNYEAAKKWWYEVDAEWIKEYGVKKAHASHKKRWEWELRIRNRSDSEVEWLSRGRWCKENDIWNSYDGCPLCLASPEHQVTLVEKEARDAEEAVREEQERQERIAREKAQEEEERQKRIAEYASRPKPTKHKCEACDMTLHGDTAWDLHCGSKDHIRNEKYRSWYCSTCPFQARSEIEYRFHLTTKKHLGVVEPKAEETYECKPCGYSCALKQHLTQHQRSKRHQTNMEREATK